jgi:uncharacterized protein (DUF433 family)
MMLRRNNRVSTQRAHNSMQATGRGGVTVNNLDRITSDPAIHAGQPTIRGKRITVRRVIEALALCPSWDDLRAKYPDLEPEDIRQALEFERV